MSMAEYEDERDRSGGSGGLLAQLTPVVKWLLIVNIGIYLLDTIFLKGAGESDGPLRSFGAFAIQSAVYGGRIWEFVTFQFLHGSLGHVLFNSIGLFFFGPWMERWWGSQKFLIFYLLCGAAGAAFYTLLVLSHLLPSASIYGSLVGASAGLFGIFVGVAVIAPHLRVALIFPPIELSMRQLVLGLLVIAGGSVLLKLGGNEGGEAGHLGGAILGFILVRYPSLLGHDSTMEVITPRIFSRKSKPQPQAKIYPRSGLPKTQDNELDRILDKISAQGYESLSTEEHATLLAASDTHKSQP